VLPFPAPSECSSEYSKMASTARPTYTAKQLHQYLEHVQYPYGGESSDLPQPTLENLHTLMMHQLSTIPFENLSLHYTTCSSPHIFTEPEAIFQKIMLDRKRRGGYCMALNTLFGTILRGLGSRARGVGARTSNGSTHDGESESVVFGGWYLLQISCA
jgi:arylamine N-acetyltransferase